MLIKVRNTRGDIFFDPGKTQAGFKTAQDGPEVRPRALDVLTVMVRADQIDAISCNANVIA